MFISCRVEQMFMTVAVRRGVINESFNANII